MPWVTSHGGRWIGALAPFGAEVGLLRSREGWRPEVQDREPPYWCFGVDGAARIVVTPEPDGFLMYVAEWEKSWVILRLDSVQEWLDANEGEFATPLQEKYKRAFEGIRALKRCYPS